MFPSRCRFVLDSGRSEGDLFSITAARTVASNVPYIKMLTQIRYYRNTSLSARRRLFNIFGRSHQCQLFVTVRGRAGFVCFPLDTSVFSTDDIVL